MNIGSQAPSAFERSGIPLRLEAVDTVCLELREFAAANGLEANGFALELLARECLNNAVLHGGREQANRTASLALRVGRRWLRLQVAHEGAGFNWRLARREVPEVSATSGRGMAISACYADRVGFNQRGNRITLWLENSPKAKRSQNG
jgi:serine/threonine-protein kinase RsbW